MDYKKIKLENERSTHLTKRLNRLSSWGFFKVLYRNSMARMLGTNFLVIILCVPLAYILFMASISNNAVQQSLPFFAAFGTGTGIWTNVAAFYSDAVTAQNIESALWCMLAALPLALMFSGAFAIVRDAFWVGDIKVFKRFASGVSANIGYAAVSAAAIAAMVSGTYLFYIWASGALDLWLAIVLTVLIALVAMLLAIYLLIVCSVSVTYKQSVRQTLDDSWRLLCLNIIPNILNFLIMLVPFAAYFLLGSTLQIVFYMFIFMVGGFYFPFIWQTHMMKTFALFHPVAVNKKGETKTQQSGSQQPTKA